MQKKLVQFILCVIISALFFSIWSILLSSSKNEPINVNICVIIPAALGIGWGSFKVIFKKIGVGGFKSLGELLRLVAESTSILITSLFIFIWVTKLIEIKTGIKIPHIIYF